MVIVQAARYPVRMAAVKLKKVPINTYSVTFRSFDLFNSPNLNMDLAAKRNPIPSIFSVKMNVNINIRSRKPIHLPAFGSPFKDGLQGTHELYSMKDLTKIEVGVRIAIYAVNIIHAV